jgi:tripartite-type tricarboxylate transporter receptor subunit TctC
MNQQRRSLLRAAAALPVAACATAFSQQFPSKPIRIIVPASAGTSIYAIARYFSEPLSKRLNVPVVVENVGGAGGLMAYTAVARAAPDGYTLIMSGLALYLLPHFSEAAVQFDSLKDFTAVTRVARTPLAVVVRADSPYQKLHDLIQGMKAKPDGLTYSSQGVGSSASLCVALLNEMSKTKANHVPYKLSSVAVTDVVAGHVTFTCQGSVGVLPLVQAGKLRALAVTSASRWDSLPDVPTVAQAGLPGFEMSPGIDFMAPASLPAPIVQRLSDEFMQLGQAPQYKEFLAKSAISHELLDHKALAKLMPNEAAYWKRAATIARGS